MGYGILSIPLTSVRRARDMYFVRGFLESKSIYCVREQRPLLRDCAVLKGSPEPSLFTYVISSRFITWSGSLLVLFLYSSVSFVVVVVVFFLNYY